MITISGTISKAWLSQAIGVAFDRDYYFDPDRRHTIDCLCNEYVAETFPDIPIFYSESNLGRKEYWAVNQVQIGGIQPNMIFGMLLGAEFAPADDRDADITPGCLRDTGPADLPSPEALLTHGLVRQFDRQIAEVRRSSEGRLRPIPPFFWDASGRAAIHGVLTTAQKLCGETIFIDMLAEPKKCMAILRWLADAYILLCRHFAQAGDLSLADVHVGECSCCMVSPELAEQFIVPVTSYISRHLGPIRFHACGSVTHLLQAFSKIEGLHSLDLGGETSIRRARETFGATMPISIAPLPCDMSAGSTEPILTWARRILEGNAKGDLACVFHLEPGYNIETIRALTEFVNSQ